MEKLNSNTHFTLMAFGFMFRDLFIPRKKVLKEAGIKTGFRVLDYGCGPGGYILPLSEMVEKKGFVYALDIHPMAIAKVNRLISKRNLENVQTIRSGCQTGLQDNAVDLVLLYDTYHALESPGAVLKEIHRILKPEGMLSFSDHHMQKEEIIKAITDTGLFRHCHQGNKTVTFIKVTENNSL